MKKSLSYRLGCFAMALACFAGSRLFTGTTWGYIWCAVCMATGVLWLMDYKEGLP
jgi:hypothetical protein